MDKVKFVITRPERPNDWPVWVPGMDVLEGSEIEIEPGDIKYNSSEKKYYVVNIRQGMHWTLAMHWLIPVRSKANQKAIVSLRRKHPFQLACIQSVLDKNKVEYVSNRWARIVFTVDRNKESYDLLKSLQKKAHIHVFGGALFPKPSLGAPGINNIVLNNGGIFQQIHVPQHGQENQPIAIDAAALQQALAELDGIIQNNQ
jgi:hypothetical protein